MWNTIRAFTNRAGLVFNELKTAVLFAEDLNDISDNLDYLKSRADIVDTLAGGTTTQILTKDGTDDYDFSWHDAPEGGGSVSEADLLPTSVYLNTFYSSTNAIPLSSDKQAFACWASTDIVLFVKGYGMQRAVMGTLKTGYNVVYGIVIAGDYAYFFLGKTTDTPDSKALVRVPLSNINQAGTLMTFSGAITLANTDNNVRMAYNGTYFYFNYQAGNSATNDILSKFTISDTTLTYVSDITLNDGQDLYAFVVKTDGSILANLQNGKQQLRYWNASGAVQGWYDNLFPNSTNTYISIMINNIYVISGNGGFRTGY